MYKERGVRGWPMVGGAGGRLISRDTMEIRVDTRQSSPLHEYTRDTPREHA